jgi:hypothetical protein
MIDMPTLSAQLPRERTIRWDDPRALAAAGQTMSGRDFLEAMLRGDVPLPPICRLVDFSIDRVGDGSVEMVLNRKSRNTIRSAQCMAA